MEEFFKMRGGIYTQGLIDMTNYISQFRNPKEMSVLEIGSYTGESSQIFAENFNSVMCIDPFINGYDMEDLACHMADFDLVYKKFLENTNRFTNLKHLKLTSDEAFMVLFNTKFDLIYIDGDHTYKQVKKDIQNYKSLVGPGGFISGHDYDNAWPNVIRAIHENFIPDQTFCDFSWIKRL